MIINALEAVLTAIVYLLAAAVFFRTVPENVPQREKLCRSRLAGIILTLPPAIMCVPLAEPVSPAFLLPWLLPLAVILPVLCIFFIDHYAARGFALWMVVSAYGMIHTAFDCKIPGSGILTVILWLAGIAGMIISAKPYFLRDWLRKSAEKSQIRYISGAILLALAAVSVYIASMTIIKL